MILLSVQKILVHGFHITRGHTRRGGSIKGESLTQVFSIKEILDRQFCGSLQNFLTGNTCSIQSIQYRDNGSGGIHVNFLIIIGPFAVMLSAIVAQLKSINDGLDMIEGFQFIPGIISGKLIPSTFSFLFKFSGANKLVKSNIQKIGGLKIKISDHSQTVTTTSSLI